MTWLKALGSEAPRTGFLAKGPILNLISALFAELLISKFYTLIRKHCRTKSADEASFSFTQCIRIYNDVQGWIQDFFMGGSNLQWGV